MYLYLFVWLSLNVKEKRETVRLTFLSYFSLKVLLKDPISYSPWFKCTIQSYIEKTVREENR